MLSFDLTRLKLSVECKWPIDDVCSLLCLCDKLVCAKGFQQFYDKIDIVKWPLMVRKICCFFMCKRT